MNNKPFKKLVVPILSTVLLLASVSTASANTAECDLSNSRGIYNYSVVRNTSSNHNYNFNIVKLFKTFQNNANTKVDSPVQNVPGNNTEIHSDKNTPQQPTATPEPAPTPKPTPAPAPTPEVTPNPAQKPTPADTSNAKHALTAAEIEMVEYVNQARAEAGLQPLAIDVDLSYVARVKSKDMQDNNYFSHTSPTYGSPFEMMKKFGIQYKSAAENIAINSSVKGAHNAFMNSEGHRNNILNPRMTHIGIGIENRHYTQMFIQK